MPASGPGVAVRIDLEALRTLQRYPRQAMEAKRRWAGRGVQYTRGVMVRIIRSRQSTIGRTGKLSASVQGQVNPSGFEVYPTDDKAIFVDQPTRPHLILPRRAKALAFPRAGGRRGTIGGQPRTGFRFGGRTAVTGLVVVRSVRHPGTKGMHFSRDTASEVATPLADMLQGELERGFDDAARQGRGR